MSYFPNHGVYQGLLYCQIGNFARNFIKFSNHLIKLLPASLPLESGNLSFDFIALLPEYQFNQLPFNYLQLTSYFVLIVLFLGQYNFTKTCFKFSRKTICKFFDVKLSFFKKLS